MTVSRKRRSAFSWTAFAGVAAVAVACTTPAPATASCPDAQSGQSFCGACGTQCFYCASGTCPADPCTDQACDATSECPTTTSQYPGWSYCGLCTTSQECRYCPAGKCASDPCGATCDGSGGFGPVGGSSGGSSSGSTASSSSGGSTSGGVTTCGNCPGQLECSTIVGNCVVQSCACSYVIDGSDGDSTWYLANGQCFMCQQSGLTTGDCTPAATAAAQAIVNCQ